MEGIEEKLLKSRDRKSGQNISENHEKEKHCSTRKEMIQFKSTTTLMRIKSLQGVETTQTSSHSLENLGRSLTSLLSSLRHEAHPHQAKNEKQR
jgi:hypothetical protein